MAVPLSFACRHLGDGNMVGTYAGQHFHQRADAILDCGDVAAFAYNSYPEDLRRLGGFNQTFIAYDNMADGFKTATIMPVAAILKTRSMSILLLPYHKRIAVNMPAQAPRRGYKRRAERAISFLLCDSSSVRAASLCSVAQAFVRGSSAS